MTPLHLFTRVHQDNLSMDLPFSNCQTRRRRPDSSTWSVLFGPRRILLRSHHLRSDPHPFVSA